MWTITSHCIFTSQFFFLDKVPQKQIQDGCQISFTAHSNNETELDITYLFKQSNESDVKTLTPVQVWQNASNKASATFEKITRFWSLAHTSFHRWSPYLEICSKHLPWAYLLHTFHAPVIFLLGKKGKGEKGPEKG